MEVPTVKTMRWFSNTCCGPPEESTRTRQRIKQNHSVHGGIREGARSPVVTLVEKKVSQTAAQELDARLRILGSVSSARPAPPSRRTTIGPRPRALHAFSGVLLGWGFE